MKATITSKLLTTVLAILPLILLGSMTIKAAPGDLDATFGVGGKVIDGLGRSNHVAIQVDGKIIVVGEMYSQNWPVATRYLPDGSLDPTFGDAGRATINLYGAAVDVAIQTDGKILVAVRDLDDSLNGYLVRLTPNGSLDTSFGTNGIRQFGDSSITAVQPDGKILIAAISSVYRLNPDGSLDPTFQQNCGHVGAVVYPLTRTAAVVQPDAKIVTAFTPGSGRFAAHRCDSNGLLDAGFGSGGITITPIGAGPAIVSSIAIQNDGKIVIAGSANSNFAVIRYNTNGTLDPGFGSGGITATPIGSPHLDASARKTVATVMIQDDGKIVVAGTDHNGSNNDFALVRYNPNGSLDTTFGGGDGIATVDFNNSDDVAFGMALDGQGRAVVVGQSNSAFAIARFLLAPSSVAPNRTRFDFDGDGRADISVFRPSDKVWYLNRSTDGFSATQFGLSTDNIAPADYDGDGKTDISVYRDGTWFWLNSSNGSFNSRQFGVAGDTPLPADYSGDGRDDLAVYRGGVWWALNIASGEVTSVQFGLATDKPVAADYDGDGRTDLAVYRDGTWYLNRSTQGFAAIQFGLPTDRPVVGDYDGDRKSDVAVYRDGTWYALGSSNGFNSFPWGLPTDIPVPADYDGDGRFDLAVFRDGTWWISRGTGGSIGHPFGISGDKPVPAA